MWKLLSFHFQHFFPHMFMRFTEFSSMCFFVFTCCRFGITSSPASDQNINGQPSCSWLFGFPCLSGKLKIPLSLLPPVSRAPFGAYFISLNSCNFPAITAWPCGFRTWSNTSRSRNMNLAQRPSLRNEWSTSLSTSPWKIKCIAKDTTSMTSKFRSGGQVNYWFALLI